MKSRTILTLTVLGAMFSSATAKAETSKHLRVLIHGTAPLVPVELSGTATIGLSGWIIAPSITDNASKWVVLAGGRIDAFGANLELHAGTVINGDTEKVLIDLRLGIGPGAWGIPLSSWTNLQLIIDTENAAAGYAYTELDWVMPFAPTLVGVETENLIFEGSDSNAIGLHAKVKLGKMIIVAAYQRHVTILSDAVSKDQLWFRLILNH